MPHNGSPIQINMDFCGSPGEYAFLNLMKGSARFTLNDNSGVPVATDLNDNGYPLNTAGLWYTNFYIPTQAERSGNLKARWTGDGTITTNITAGGDVITGSKSGVDGSFTFRPTVDRVFIGFEAVNAANPITSFEVYYEEDEALLDAGEIFAPKFLERCSSAGVIRFLNWQLANGSFVSKWSDRKPVGYVTWISAEFRSSIYRGATTNVGDAYSCNLGDGGTPADRDGHIIVFNADATGNNPTLNGIPITNASLGGGPGEAIYTSQRPVAGHQGYVVYDDDRNQWIKSEGDVTGGSHTALSNGVPIEVCLALCKKVGAHPWLHVPHLDTSNNFATGLATLVKAYAETEASWMVPRYEKSNEVWNTFAGFEQSQYASVTANDRWGVEAINDMYGRWVSLMGEAISDVYGDDRSKYQVICAMPTFAGAVATLGPARLSGRHVSVDGGDPASDWATHGAAANYFLPSISVEDFNIMADDYAAADTAGKAVIAAEYCALVLVNGTSYPIPVIEAKMIEWSSFLAGYDLPLTYYEGGYSPDYEKGDTEGNDLKEASKNVPALKGYLKEMFSICMRVGEYPSVFQLSGTDNVWSVLDPSIYVDPDTPQWEAILETVASETPIRVTFRFVA